MDPLILFKAALMGVVEGLTEFLPVSSTGHLIVAGSLLHFVGVNAATFEIAIQSGAMIALIWVYRARILGTLGGVFTDEKARRFALNLLIAFLPAAAAGFFLSHMIKEHLFQPVPVAIAFVVGGIVILVVEWAKRRVQYPVEVTSVDDMTHGEALKVGLAQCLALIPGTSRSGATIIGGMLTGLSRKAATEFSFYLAIPTLIMAGAYALYKERHALSTSDLPVFAVGTFVSFCFALICIRWFIRYVSRHDFTAFAWYRIVFGALILWTAYAGLVTWAH